MPEYAKMKNAELEALLKERNLPTGGKKADMVDRLQKDDEKPAKPVNDEDQIDWDDEVDEAPALAAAKDDKPATAAEETVANADAKAVQSQVTDVEPPKADAASTEPPVAGEEKESAEVKTEEKKEPAPDYSIGLAATNLDEEIEKRKKRALKFGTKIEDNEELKRLERAKKFGEVGPPKGLDEALPERTRKRGREDGAEDATGNKRRGGGRAGGRGGRGGQAGQSGRGGRERRDNKPRETQNPRKDDNKTSSGGWMNEKDRAAAEARKAKFAKPTA